MRLIDADALYNSFGASGNCGSCQLDAYKCQYYNEHTLMEFCERIDDAPTVDAVEVVRCKDCKWHEDEEPSMVWCPYVVGSWVGEEGYCSFGERKDGASDN